MSFKYLHFSSSFGTLRYETKWSPLKTVIAKKLGVHRSTIKREIERNSKQRAKGLIYDARFAQLLYDQRQKLKPKADKFTYETQRRIRWLLKCKWSPEQISGVCKKKGIPMVSTESIYLWIYQLKKQGDDLTIHLRRSHKKRRKRSNNKQKRSIIKNKTSIEQRPKVVDKKRRVGDFEVDLVKCTNGYLVTCTDRTTNFNLIKKIPNKKAETTKIALIKALLPFKDKIHTITSDNGTEFARFEKVVEVLEVKWYFAHPYCSSERGCNENQNGLFRQYFKRNTDLKQINNKQIKDIQRQVNHRPRKKLNFNKPFDLFFF